jgi:hypothetical protein
MLINLNADGLVMSGTHLTAAKPGSITDPNTMQTSHAQKVF